MHTWTFTSEEVSAGHYITQVVRSTGDSCKTDGDENEIFRAVHEAYLFDRKKQIIPGEAAYAISRAILRNWEWTYHDRTFGSWSGISWSKNGSRVDYDGKDMILMVRTHDTAKHNLSWNGRIQILYENEGIKYFKALLYAY